ncbi:MAG: 30S ribosomal protein S8 [Mycoplasma sp.]|nr:30S ribosomal protein S8 [Mycoplasma sp.]
MTDPISDLVVRIKNANKAHIPSISFSSSSLTSSIAEVLKQEGYIENYKIISHNKKKTTIIDLKYKNLLPVIHGIKQISKPGLRVYQECKKLPYVLHGLGTAVISTSKGVMTDKEARKNKIGGEVLIYIW